MDRLNPENLLEVNDAARVGAAAGEDICPIEMDEIVIAPDAIDALIEIIARYAGSERVLLVTDRTPIFRKGVELRSVIRDRLARRVEFDYIELPPAPADEYHPTLEDALRLAERVKAFTTVVSVGAGSITDVVKHARSVAESHTKQMIRFVCVPTAASVTAYTSAIAVLTHAGCKRNFQSRLPEAVVCDLQTLADAPKAMTAAGFADVLARSVAYGDWVLAHELGMDDKFSLVPNRLLEPTERAMLASADAIACGDLDAVRLLTEGLLLAGMCMSVINHTAPISGWEHVISHFLDMTAARDGRRMALHGGQVAVGTLIAARAYEQSWDALDIEAIQRNITERDAAAYHKTIAGIFDECDPSGRMTAEVISEFDVKVLHWNASTSERAQFAETHKDGTLMDRINTVNRPLDVIDDALRRAGAPRRFCELDQQTPDVAGLAAIRHGYVVRSRFTLGDLLQFSGWLTESRAEALLSAAG